MNETMEVEGRFVDLLEPNIAGELLLPDDWNSVLGGSLRPTKTPYAEWPDPYVENEFGVFHYGGRGPYSAAIRPFTLDKTIAKVIQWELLHTDPQNRNWRGLAYAGAFDEAGNVLVARGFHLYGAHRGDFDGDGISANREGMPWLWVGGENNLGPSEVALDTWEAIIVAGEGAEGHKYTRLIGHQEIQGGTSCPGTRAMAYLQRHRTSASFTPAPVQPPPADCWCKDLPILRLFDGWKANVELQPFVQNMQSQLANHGRKAANTFNRQCEADGQFGNGTLVELEGFNDANGITNRSECGPETWRKLNHL